MKCSTTISKAVGHPEDRGELSDELFRTFGGSHRDQELNYTYGDAVSRRDADAFAETWAEDAVWHLPWLDPAHGREAIVKLWLEQMANYPFHNFSGFVGALTVDGDRASGRVWTSELVENIQGASGRVTGRYDDQYVKRGGRWYFVRKAFTPLHGMDSIVS